MTGSSMISPARRRRAAAGPFTLVLLAFVALPGLVPSALTGQQKAEGDSVATLTGRVVSAMTGGPLEDAQVLLARAGRGTSTDERGRFSLADVPAGSDTVRVRLIGFADERLPITLQPGATTDVTFLLSETVLRMEEINVSVDRPAPVRLEGFERRRRRGLGLFLTPEEIEERDARQPTDYLRNQPGISVSRSVLGKSQILMNRTNLDCQPEVLLDGVLVHDFHMDDLNQDDIWAIEIYRGSSEVPPEFTMHFEGCGLIVIWSRAGGAEPPS